MEPSFWHERWEQGQIGFHRDEVHPDLAAHADWLLGSGDQRVLVPLCGKTHDLAFIASGGNEAIGVELSEIAVRELFEREGLEPEVEQGRAHRIFRAGRIEVFCGDIFDLRPDDVGPIDRVWDRAAMVALTREQRRRYVPQMRALTRPRARILLNTLSYNPCDKQGPPHSVDESEVGLLYDGAEVELFERRDGSAEIAPHWAAAGMTWLVSHLFRITLPGS